MGFLKNLSIKSVGNFVSNNVKSTVNDGAHLVQQYVNNPVTNALAPTALSVIGIPPEVYGVVKNYQNKGLNSLQGIKEAVAGSEYSEEIQSLTEEQFQAIAKTNEEQFQALSKIAEEQKRQEEEKKKKDNKTKLYIIVGGIFLLVATSYVTYRIFRKK
jgi:hypothetical protein